MPDVVYGIDLGTTYSAVARIDDHGTAQVIPNFINEPTTPSVILFESADNVIVGREAKNAALTDPDNACLLIKRKMGTDFAVDYQGQEYTPESLSALILKSLVAAANDHEGLDVKKVVITVPAYFGTQEKEATKQAGTIAGLEVIGIVTEPVAAALSVGMKLGQDKETVMVYDLGGGTFDTTVMTVGAGEVEVVGVDGSRTLGGADWDEALVNLMLTQFKAEVGAEADECEADDEFLLELQLDAERIKRDLTLRESVVKRISWGTAKANVTITRADFEAATAHLIDDTIEISRRTVADAQSKVPGLTIDRVLLVGGSSRMPMVANALREKLGWDPVNTDFDLAVAKGAAIYGQAQEEKVLAAEGQDVSELDQGEEKLFLGGATSLNVKNVLARGLGLRLVRGEAQDPYIHFFAHANDAVPSTPEPMRAGTVSDNQTTISIALFEQAGESESEVVEDNNELKQVDLPMPRPMPKGSPIEIVFDITGEGIVKIRATEPESGNTVDLEAAVSQLNAEQVEAATSQISAIAVHS